MSKPKTNSYARGQAGRVAITIAAVIASLAPLCRGADKATTIDEPVLLTETVPRETYGDAKNVELLAKLCGDEDPRVRERSIYALGQVHNDKAIASILKAVNDTDPNVRCAAVTAAGQYTGPDSVAVVTIGLADRNGRVVLEALRIAAQKNLRETARSITDLCRRDDPAVQAAAIETLMRLRLDPDSDLLKALMKSPSTKVRLRAVECIALSRSITDTTLVSSLTALAGPDQPAAIRGAAIAAAGKLDFRMVSALATEASKDGDPFLRRGALQAFRNARRSEQVAGFLSDPSPLVVLAAVRATGEIRNTASTARLLQILIATPSPDLHNAARDALVELGADAVAKPVGELLEAQAAGREAKEQIHIRNIRTLCRLLGMLKSKEKFALRLRLFNSLKIDDQIQLDLVPSLATTGSPDVARDMIARLPYCNSQAAKWLWARGQMPPPPVEYDQAVHAAIIDALASLGANEAVDTIIKTVEAQYSGSRLDAPVTSAAKALAVLATPATRTQIADAVILLLSNDNFSAEWHTSQFAMAKTAGKLKLISTTDALRRILEQQRYSWLTMRTAAWAIQEITGETSAIGEPRVYESDQWIVRQKTK